MHNVYIVREGNRKEICLIIFQSETFKVSPDVNNLLDCSLYIVMQWKKVVWWSNARKAQWIKVVETTMSLIEILLKILRKKTKMKIGKL